MAQITQNTKPITTVITQPPIAPVVVQSVPVVLLSSKPATKSLTVIAASTAGGASIISGILAVIQHYHQLSVDLYPVILSIISTISSMVAIYGRIKSVFQIDGFWTARK